MLLCIGTVLNREETDAIRSEIEALSFVDGRTTAGWAARLVKDNEQADGGDRRAE